MNFFGTNPLKDNEEMEFFKKHGIPTTESIYEELYPDDDDYDDDANIEMTSQHFFISSHGKRLLHPDFPRITVPENVFLYFQSDDSKTCSRYSEQDTVGFVCYNEEFFDDFRNVTEGGWVNAHGPRDVIYDCLLTPDEIFLSKAIVCDKTFGTPTILDITQPILLSDVIIAIKNYVHRNRLEPPYNIFCSFCLVDSNMSMRQLTTGGRKSKKIKKSKKSRKNKMGKRKTTNRRRLNARSR